MYLSHTIDRSRTAVNITHFYEDGSQDVLARMPNGDFYRLNRFYITPPTLVCQLCSLPMFVKKVNRKEMVECPDHARHMYEHCYMESQNTEKYNHKTRRHLIQQCKRWQNVWLKTMTARSDAFMKANAESADRAKLMDRLDEISEIGIYEKKRDSVFAPKQSGKSND